VTKVKIFPGSEGPVDLDLFYNRAFSSILHTLHTHTFSSLAYYVFHASLLCVLPNKLNLMLQEAEQSAEEERGHQAHQGRKERQEKEKKEGPGIQ
jgi:hypothetical protein